MKFENGYLKFLTVITALTGQVPFAERQMGVIKART